MKKIINTEKAPSPIGPYNQAVKAGDFLYISGQIALDSETGKIESHTVAEQTELLMTNLSHVLQEADLQMSDIVKVTAYLSDMSRYDEFNKVYGSFFDHSTAPAREVVEVSRLPKDALAEVSAIAYIPR